MRSRVAALVLALAMVLVGTPAYADNDVGPDSLACAATGSYSRIIDNEPYTFWLVAEEPWKGGTARRYWHVEHLQELGGVYVRSYYVQCTEQGIDSWKAIVSPDAWKFNMCEYDSYTTPDPPRLRYTWTGDQYSWMDSGTAFSFSRFAYWRILQEDDIGGWKFIGTEVVVCPAVTPSA